MIAFITGATSGIGKSASLLFAKNGYDVILTGRRKDRLSAVAEEIRKTHGVRTLTLCFDICDQEAVKKNVNTLDESWAAIDVLVNNAGLAAGFGPIQDGLTADWERMIDTNIKGLLYATRHVSPIMVRSGKGHIVNIGSLAGKEVYPGGNVYCSTKHAVDALSKAMRLDMLNHGIRVTAIHPGMAETEFSLVRYKGDESKAKKVYEGVVPLSADDVAEAILWAVLRPAHVNINEIVLTPTAQGNATTVVRKKTD
jgi:3-hydroxy acid dehydrogenase/malonic semialdehyde reductase